MSHPDDHTSGSDVPDKSDQTEMSASSSSSQAPIVSQQTNSVEPDDSLSPRRVLTQAIVSVVVVFGLVGAGAFFFQAELEALSTWFVETFGLFGVVLGVLATDAFGVPIPPDAYLFAAVASGSAAVPVLVVTSVTSVVGGNLAYFIGRHLERFPFLKRRMDVFRDKGEKLVSRWGVLAVAVAAWTPVPFSVICWFAGAYRMNYRRFFLTTFHRVPRIVLYYYMIVLGWAAGAVDVPMDIP